MGFRTKVARLWHEVSRKEASAAERALRVAERGVIAVGLYPAVTINRRWIVETLAPPKPFRGMRDVVVRRGSVRDLVALSTIDATEPDLVRDRLARGDLAYVGELEGEVLCHTWFHPGPTPFDEDRRACTAWGLDESTYWSYNGASRVDARASGVFVKLFQEALRDVFEVQGAKRVQGFIRDTNDRSLTMHERMGFSTLGAMVTVAVGGVKWLHWRGGGRTRQWLLPRNSVRALSLPPV